MVKSKKYPDQTNLNVLSGGEANSTSLMGSKMPYKFYYKYYNKYKNEWEEKAFYSNELDPI